MNNIETRKCPVPDCGKDAEFIRYIDIESGKDLPAAMPMDGEGKCGVSGGFLSGSLRKYRCPDGHEFTNK